MRQSLIICTFSFIIQILRKCKALRICPALNRGFDLKRYDEDHVSSHGLRQIVNVLKDKSKIKLKE